MDLEQRRKKGASITQAAGRSLRPLRGYEKAGYEERPLGLRVSFSLDLHPYGLQLAGHTLKNRMPVEQNMILGAIGRRLFNWASA